MSNTWSFRENGPYINQVYDKQSDGTGYKTGIIYDSNPITVTWYPERMGLQVSGGSNLGEKTGRDAAMFGLILIKLILSGDDCMIEI